MEDYLIRGIIAFLPRIEQEEAKPTFEHPENWNQLNLQEKANLIILDNIIKLACIDDTREDVITEIQAFYARSEEDVIKEIRAPHLALDREPSTMKEEVRDNPNKKTKQPHPKALQEEKGHGYPDNLIEAG